MKTICRLGYHHNSFVATHGIGDHMPKCMSCHKAILEITRRTHCFHDYIYIYIYILYVYVYICIFSFVFWTFIFYNLFHLGMLPFIWTSVSVHNFKNYISAFSTYLEVLQWLCLEWFCQEIITYHATILKPQMS